MANSADHSSNSFNALRLFAAWLVLWSHSYVLTGANIEPLKAMLGLSAGHVAVDIFFFISGLLIAGSIARGTPWPDFIKSRALRILPGLWVVLLLTCMTYVLAGALRQAHLDWTSVARYLLRNGTLVSSDLQYNLGTLFSENPYPKVVNGSLWTLPWEVRMYLVLALTGYLLRRQRLLAYLGLAASGWVIWHFGASLASGGLMAYPDPWRFMYFFFAGAAIQQLFAGGGAARAWWPACSLALIVITAIVWPRATPFAYSFALPPLVLGIANAWVGQGRLARAVRLNDLSYGTYLYAFPIQQAIVSVGPQLSPAGLTMAATLPTLAAAWLSWRLIEGPALSLKRRRVSAPRPSVDLAQP
jgi:peptidoglycan/LPS O-acetylase OafA/YrhL